MEKTKFLIGDDNSLTISIPFQKSSIDLENRTVSGWATVDNEDSAGEVVTADASHNAFNEFRGNIREQHGDLAVGKMLQFTQKDVYDENGNTYTGIFVKVYVSKGAENTWQKVLDGTLNGFSIGGGYPNSGIRKQYIPDENRYRKFITKYVMTELSLVDSPMNTLCNFVSIKKMKDGTIELEGMLAETTIENVFWCADDRQASVSIQDEELCLTCNKIMQNAGWMEAMEGETGGAIKKVLDSFLNSNNKEPQTKGGSDMSDENVSEVVETTPNAKVEEQEVSEVAEVVEPDLQNVLLALNAVKDTLEKVTADGQDRESALAKIRTTVEGVQNSVDNKLGELLEKHTKLADEFNELKGGLGAMEKRLDSVVEATAFRKSSDVEVEDVVLQKSKKTGWSGAFLPPSFDQ